MNKQIKLVAGYKDVLRSIMWISLQEDGSISAGISDRTFIVQRFRNRSYIFNAYNRITLIYTSKSESEIFEPVLNPHLTFHPPLIFHYRANRDDILFEGIIDLQIVLSQQNVYPWIRFISHKLENLTRYNPRIGEDIDSRIIEMPGVDYSIGVGIDFIGNYTIDEHFFVTTIDWKNHRLKVFADLLPPQESTLVWFHEY